MSVTFQITLTNPSRAYSMSPPAGKIWRSAHPLQRRRKTVLQPPFTTRHLSFALAKAWNNSAHVGLPAIGNESPRDFFVSIAFILLFSLSSLLIDINRSIENHDARGKKLSRLVIKWFVVAHSFSHTLSLPLTNFLFIIFKWLKK